MFDKRLMAMCPESKKYIAGNILLQWIELCLNAVMIGLIADSAQKLYRRELTPSGAAPALAIIAVTILIRFFITRYAVRMSYLASRTVKRKMRDLIYKKILKLGMSYREKVTTAELVQESVEGVDQLESYFGQYVPQFFYAFLAPLTLFGLFTAAGSLRTALVLLICVPLIPGTIMMVQKIAKRILAKYWTQYTQLGSTFLENLQGMTTLKIYKADAQKHEQMNEESENFRVVTMKVLTMQLNSIIIMDLLAYGGTAVGIVLATRSFAEGTLGLARCLFMILLSADFFLPMRKLGSYFHVAMNGMAASDRIFRFLELEEPAERPEQFPEKGGNFLLKSVSFSYDSDREVLHRVNMQIPRNSFMGIVGESGSGKSTVANMVTRLLDPTEGEIILDGENITKAGKKELRAAYRKMQMIFQAPTESFDPRRTLGDGIGESLRNSGRSREETRKEVERLLELCGLTPDFAGRYPHEVSGGQCQRAAIARALAIEPGLLICDEATSALDVTIQKEILELLNSLRRQKGSKLSILFISHDIALVQQFCDRLLVMYKGKIVEQGTPDEIIKNPRDEYTKRLIDSIL